MTTANKNRNEGTRRSLVPAVVALLVLLVAGTAAQAAAEPALPGYVKIHLSMLDEAYRVLGMTAEKIWPGWKNYRDFPFMFTYTNGIQVLIGHPNPPAEFHKLEGLSVAGMDVYADVSKVSDIPQEEPLFAGGGPNFFGTNKTGEPVQTVFMNYFSARKGMKGGQGAVPGPYTVESQIMCFIHELFHCFQMSGGMRIDDAGNPSMNPDTDYAVYSDIEGKALLKAYGEKDREKAAMYIRDFVAARMIKYEKSMPPEEQRAEAWEELVEGTAVYTSVRLAELFAGGYDARIKPARPYTFTGFRNSRFFIEGYQKSLRKSAAKVYDLLDRDYEYGCFEAILLERYVPGWQKVFSEKTTNLYAELSRLFPVKREDLAGYEKRFVKLYGADKTRVRCAAAMKKRDDAYYAMKDRRGMTYIINLSRVVKNENAVYPDTERLTVGMVHIYLEGLPAAKIGNCEISRVPGPLVREQLYHIRVVDTKGTAGAGPYSVTFTKQNGNVYEGAVITTPLFTLRAPLVRIDESSGRVKFTPLPVLAGRD